MTSERRFKEVPPGWVAAEFLCQYRDHIDLGLVGVSYVVSRGTPAFFPPRKKAAKKAASGSPAVRGT